MFLPGSLAFGFIIAAIYITFVEMRDGRKNIHPIVVLSLFLAFFMLCLQVVIINAVISEGNRSEKLYIEALNQSGLSDTEKREGLKIYKKNRKDN